MALRDQPYLPLFVDDLLTDEKLIECSAASTGVYTKILCLMHKSKVYGKLMLKQKYKQNESKVENFALMLDNALNFKYNVILESIVELLYEEVVYIDGDFLCQKRMIKDNELSEKRAKSGSKGGSYNGTDTLKNKEKIATAKTKANAVNGIEYVNGDESVIENEDNEADNKKYSREEILENSILDYFKFTAQINPDKASLVFQFCTALFNAGKIDRFRNQFKNYCEYKDLTGYKHKFHNFLGTQSELFVDGAWDEENWAEKLKDLKSGSKKMDENNIIFPDTWNQQFYLKLTTADKRTEYVVHLKDKIGGGIIFVGVNNSPQWKYDEAVKTDKSFITNGMSKIGSEKV